MMTTASHLRIVECFQSYLQYEKILQQEGYLPIQHPSRCAWAIEKDNFELLKLFHKEGYELTYECFINAIEKKNVTCVEYLLDHECECDGFTFEEAVESGNTEIVQLFLNVYPHINEYSDPYLTSVRNGDLNMVKYLYENMRTTDEDDMKIAFITAIQFDKQDILEYIISKNFILHENAFDEVVERNSLRYLKILCENGYKWPADYENNQIRHLTIYAYGMNYHDILKYLIQQGYPYRDYMCHLFNDEIWFQLIQLHNGVINQYNLHLRHKIQRIQRCWIQYAYNPRTEIGYQRMQKTITNNMQELI